MSQKPKGSQRKPLSKRERIIRTGAIVIVLAMVMSLLAGALSFSPPPASAAQAQFVQISTSGEISVDTDGDGIENNNDEDVDGDGVVNGEDSDIDGDGIENFDDADPIGVLGIDSNGPQKPIRPDGAGDNFGVVAPLILGISVVAVMVTVLASISARLLSRRCKK